MQISQIDRGATDFQQPVAVEALRAQLARELPGERITEVAELPAGQFNNTFKVSTASNAYILKVAPAASADVFYSERNLMLREASVADTLQSLSPLIPEYVAFFQVDEREASLQRFVAGRLWHDVSASLSETENAQLWTLLGDFARQIHSCEGANFGYPRPAENFNSWSEFIAANVAGLAADCRRHSLPMTEVETFQQLLPGFSDRLDKVTTPRLCHGDLWSRNVIIGGAGDAIHLRAVIDGERAYWGDPVSDWALILSGVPDAFWQGYGENLVAASDPIVIAVYKGMYFILNLLETVRFQTSPDEPRGWLTAINRELAAAAH